jgi:AcrR family transcriptional regulator
MTAPKARPTKREDILRHATVLMGQKGFTATTIRDVADKVDFTQAAFYYYVENKEELLYQIFREVLTVGLAQLEEISQAPLAPSAKLRSIIHMYVRRMAEHKERSTVYLQEKRHLEPAHQREVERLERRALDILRDVIKQGISAGEFRKVDPTVAALGLIGMCVWVHRWYRESGLLSIDEVASTFESMLMSGIETRGELTAVEPRRPASSRAVGRRG